MMNKFEKYKYLVEEATYTDTSYHDFLALITWKYKVKRYLEVGAYKGSTLFYVLEANPGCEAIVIDDFQISTHKELMDNIYKFNFEDRVNVYNGKDRIYLPLIMEQEQFDFVHLDADHTTEGLLFELRTVAKYCPRVIVVHDWIDPCVQQAVEKFKFKNPYWYFQVREDVFNGAVIIKYKDTNCE